jgi:hypothetical protein
MVSHHEIDPNPEKVFAITKMMPPVSLHDFQKLMGCMAAMSRLISRLSIRGLCNTHAVTVGPTVHLQ